MTATERLKAIRVSYENEVRSRGPYLSGQPTDADKIIGLCKCLEAVMARCNEAANEREGRFQAIHPDDILAIINRELGGEA